MTHYEVLNLKEDASIDEIKKRYRLLAKKYHPDVNDALNAKQFFNLISDAYQVLSDPEKRIKYDNSLTGIKYQQDNSSNQPSSAQTQHQTEDFKEEPFKKRTKVNYQSHSSLIRIVSTIGLILLFPLKLLLKLVCIVFIVLLGFIEFLMKIVAACAFIVSGLIILAGLICIFLIITSDNTAFATSPWWQTWMPPAVLLVIGFILPKISVYIVVPFALLKQFLIKFVFPHSN